ncbi:colanic acid biosynthesis acetyltransferase WcaF [Subsaximicrobium wynnwilliamsii]|uniref:colanic acid biosynthesis acetyltransferase WcaF n=1 Tax=Subsaximicrobium wynnwilliamsii TaxID=291179 RepID=UPI0011BF36BA|nr:colanic acid biosynthesis acetyltransferase WcaF [Subsaximicrobium wynnwilliamsii]TXD81379.1 colanic acid biosynthesis acetyltransferase WcaF [Subsaximicrobium wynnwilliamsii]
MEIDLSKYNNSWYHPGSKLKLGLWYITNILFFRSSLVPFSSFKGSLLKLFGAKIGNKVVIKPRVNIKYPWFLEIGENTWVGEDVWIDNVAKVTIGKNVCLSQGAMILCGSHDYTKTSFDLMIAPITLEDGVEFLHKA